MDINDLAKTGGKDFEKAPPPLKRTPCFLGGV
jgi:hypothetical protein